MNTPVSPILEGMHSLMNDPVISNTESEQDKEHHMNNPVIWFEIYVENMPRARAFYERVLGVTLERLNSPDSLGGIELWAFPMEMDRVGAGGALVKMDGVRPGGGGTVVYFACTDCAVEAQRAVEAGGTLFKAKIPIGEYGHIALVHDTEGNLVGLHSMQ